MSADFDREAWSASRAEVGAALARVRSALERHVARIEAAGLRSDSDSPLSPLPTATQAALAPPAAEDSNLALGALVRAFDLTPFERDVLVLCAGTELDGRIAQLCGNAYGEPTNRFACFSLALSALSQPHWSALSPDAPLRYWRLVHLTEGSSLTRGALRADERIVHHLTGAPHLDSYLAARSRPVLLTPGLAETHLRISEEIADVWSGEHSAASADHDCADSGDAKPIPAIQLCGTDTVGRWAIAAAACDRLGLTLYAMPLATLPADPDEQDLLQRLWHREYLLAGAVVLVDCDQADVSDAVVQPALRRLVESAPIPMFISARERRVGWRRAVLTHDVAWPTRAEQRRTWQFALANMGGSSDPGIESLVSQFNLSAPSIAAAVRGAQAKLGAQVSPPATGDAEQSLGSLLWDVCRQQARPGLGELAQRIEPIATWQDLVLPELQADSLREIVGQVRRRSQVYDKWGFASKSSRGLGISALFVGASGTGKTMAAEVVANALRLDLFRIDLSQAVSKYVGETEKNLRRIFDAAEDGGAILLFDEADALFGKRSQVKDSHDRFANIEISYLLQRMEAYAGLSILTTNMEEALDTAFMRRVRFTVEFPFPNAAERAAIWRGIFPSTTPISGLDFDRLARLDVAGGSIRNIALNAAFRAADAGEVVGMPHLFAAARGEFRKLRRQMNVSEVDARDLTRSATNTHRSN